MRIFRKQAIAHQQQRLHGKILLTQPLSYLVLTGLFVVIAIVIVVFFLAFGFTRKETVVGVLLPPGGVIRIYPLQTSVIVERLVSDKQRVNAGDILFVLSTERPSLTKGDTQQAVSRTLQERIDRLRAELEKQSVLASQQSNSLIRRQEQLLQQISQLQSEIVLQQRRVDLADRSLLRYENLKGSSFVSEAQVQEREAEALDQRTKLSALNRARSMLNHDLDLLKGETRDQPLKAYREASSLRREIGELEENLAESEARRRIVIRAPQNAIVASISGEVGQTAIPSKPLAHLLPSDMPLEAELYAPTRAIGFVKPGTEVLMRYHAFPYQRYGQYRGVVTEVSDSALEPGDVLSLSRDPNSTEPLYRVRVRLDRQDVKLGGKPSALKAGMQLEASLVLEYRKLYEWVFDPLYSLGAHI